MMTLNEHATSLVDHLERHADSLNLVVHRIAGARVLDLGIAAPGGLQAGVELARVCMAGKGEVLIAPSSEGPMVQVRSDAPVLACLASQYAGWQVSAGKYFAMGSGPMRAAYGKEAIFDHIPGRETASVAVGVLETRKLPTEEVIAYLASKLNLPHENLSLVCAPCASLSGSLQVVARSLETALHKLHELKFDVKQVVSGYGCAPLPPISANEIGAIGRTNDAILYGGQVTVWGRFDDDQLRELGPKVPSCASGDHGVPFAELFKRYDNDFYKIDPLLFSPAVVTFCNLQSGKKHTFGRMEPEVLRRSFEG